MNLQTLRYVVTIAQTGSLSKASQYLFVSQSTLSRSVKELEQQLGGGFCRCHRSFLVNLSRIRQLKKTDILLDSGVEIPMSRRLAPAVGQAFFAYYREAAEQC